MAAPLRFSPQPGRLPELIFHPVVSLSTKIGDVDTTVYCCSATGSSYAVIPGRSMKCQDGTVFAAAACALGPDHRSWFYVVPYRLVAIKREEKARVQATQLRLSQGRHCDNTFVDRSLLKLLSSTDAAPFVCKCYETWHDDAHVYSVLQYLQLDLMEYSQRQKHGCMSEGAVRRALRTVLIALHTLHQLGFTHRDISPENIMLGNEKGEGILIDFGAALPMFRDPGAVPTAVPLVGSPTQHAPMTGLPRQASTAGSTSGSGGAGSGGAVSPRSPATGVCADDDSAMSDARPALINTAAPAVAASSAAAMPVSPASASTPSFSNLSSPSTYSPSAYMSASAAASSPGAPSIGRSSSTGGSSGSGGEPLAGWLPMPPPIPPPFCKIVYVDCTYFWMQRWYGVQSDLWSLGLTLFTLVMGRPLYRVPAAEDPEFALLLQTDAAMRATPAAAIRAGAGGGGGGGGMPSPRRLLPFEEYLQQQNRRRVDAGLEPLSPQCLDLLCGLIRVRPAFRPPSAAAVLAHPWFQRPD